MLPIFSLKFNQEIRPRLVTVGRYGDKEHPSLTCGTSAGKVFVHSLQGGAVSDITFLNINKKITSLQAGRLSLDDGANDMLVVGTQTDMMVYDVAENSNVFFKELPDGANYIEIGVLGQNQKPMAFVGGNCAILGFTLEGKDDFWTVTGDHVCSLLLSDTNGDGAKELVVGSEDFDLRIYKEHGRLIHETGQLEAVTSLCDLSSNRFAFAMGNGTLGVYEGTKRLWNTKMRDKVMTTCGFDINLDGVSEVVTGWADGRVDVRDASSGEVLHQDEFGAPIAGIVTANCRPDGIKTLVACSIDGEVKGFLPIGVEHQQAATALAPAPLPKASDNKLKELSQLKQDKLFELKSYQAAEAEGPGRTSAKSEAVAIARDAEIKTEMRPVAGDEGFPAHVMLGIETESETIIKSVMLFCDGLFEGESFVAHPPPGRLTSSIQIPLYPSKQVAHRIECKVLIGATGSTVFSVRELTLELPRFPLFAPDVGGASCDSHVALSHPSIDADRIRSWLIGNFLLDDVVISAGKVALVNLSDASSLIFSVRTGELVIHTPRMEVAGNLIQSLADNLDITNVNSTADFSEELLVLQDTLIKVDGFHSVRQKLSAEMADQGGLIKSLVVRAEDSRITGDIEGMKHAYSQLYDLNRDLITAYNIRSTNHSQLLTHLKEVNQFIQRAGRLRVGKPQSNVIAACRAAIKSNNVQALFKVIKAGVP